MKVRSIVHNIHLNIEDDKKAGSTPAFVLVTNYKNKLD